MTLTLGRVWIAWVLMAFAGPAMLCGQQQAPVDHTKLQLEVRGQPGIVPMSDLELDSFGVAAIEMGLDFKSIKNRPFRAEMVVETERKLADGNSLHKKKTEVFYRDQKGRVREEQTEESPNQTIALSDPQTGTLHFLMPNMRMGFRMKIQAAIANVPHTTPWTPQPEQQSTTQVIGNQVIEGMQCEGRLDTIKVPVGAAGNAYPMEIRTERWFSAELQINLLVKHTDPRNGETMIRLVNISREEPPETLFEVPADYRIQDGEMTPVVPPDGGNR